MTDAFAAVMEKAPIVLHLVIINTQTENLKRLYMIADLLILGLLKFFFDQC